MRRAEAGAGGLSCRSPEETGGAQPAVARDRSLELFCDRYELIARFVALLNDDPPPWRLLPVRGKPIVLRHLVFGAVEYARSLGFESHPDFEKARGHLGPWTGPSAITFGRDGKPFYIQGSYDDPSYVMKALERHR